jgi:3-phytase
MPTLRKGNKQLSIFGTTGFAADHEGISIYKLTDSTGYILVSDQGANRFQIFSSEGTKQNPFEHKLLKIANVQARESDGSDVVNVPLNDTFKHGLICSNEHR